MLFYDWEKIFRTSEGNPQTMYSIVKMMYLNEVPENKYDKIYKYAQKSYIGSSIIG